VAFVSFGFESRVKNDLRKVRYLVYILISASFEELRNDLLEIKLF